jgi:hypothetical protein
MKSVYSAVRTGALNKAVCASFLNGYSTQGQLTPFWVQVSKRIKYDGQKSKNN